MLTRFLFTIAIAATAPAAVAAPAAKPGMTAAVSAAATGGARASVDRADAAALARAILDEHYDWLLRQDPIMASRRGDRRYNDRLAEVGLAATAKANAEIADRLARLGAIDLSGLPEQLRLDAELLRYELELSVAGARFHPEQMPLDSKAGVQIGLPQMGDSLAFTTEQDYADFATRLEQVAGGVDGTIELMRAGLAAGRVPPRVAVEGAVEQAASLCTEAVENNPDLSPFFRPFLGRPAGDPATERARRAIREGIVPAYRRLTAFLRDEYMPALRESVAASDGVDGRAFYDYRLRFHTTLPLTAEEIHEIGLKEVARIRTEMFEVIARTDFPQKDSLQGDELFRAFVQYLRTDPRFYYTNEEDLLAGYRDIAKRIDAELPALFGRLPRNPYGVRAMPLIAAKMGPTAYYYEGSMKAGVPAYFVANTYRLDQRPKYEMIALTLHEAVPGHHIQVATSQELEVGGEHGVHPYRTTLAYSAFQEGWALYAERLGLEMCGGGTSERGGRGLYADPYDDFGRLTYEMWRACRLVVDTGMHALGWSRQQAIDFMLANSALTPLNIEREVDRYIAWPAQACAYKLGELKIRELRAMAEERLGERFSIREFHDHLLGAGCIPLPVLEERMKRWVEARGRE
jgi:uncharacterized protein (DUF885 family)